jgi:HEAT repeat protein
MGRDLVYYCPHCWATTPPEAESCPACGAIIEDAEADIIAKYIAALNHPQPETRLRVAWLLGRMQADRAVPALLAIVRGRGQADRDPYLLSAVVKSLAQIGDQGVAPELAALLADPEVSFMARLEAADALAHLGGETAEAALRAALAAPNDSVRARVQQILNQDEEIANL